VSTSPADVFWIWGRTVSTTSKRTTIKTNTIQLSPTPIRLSAIAPADSQISPSGHVIDKRRWHIVTLAKRALHQPPCQAPNQIGSDENEHRCKDLPACYLGRLDRTLNLIDLVRLGEDHTTELSIESCDHASVSSLREQLYPETGHGSSEPGCNGVECLVSDSNVTHPLEFTDAGRAGDVEFGHEFAYDVDSREQQAPIAKLRTYLITDPQVTVGERVDLCTRTDRQVAAMVAVTRDSDEGHRNGLPIDENDPLVT
jgi:hypothetical protein